MLISDNCLICLVIFGVFDGLVNDSLGVFKVYEIKSLVHEFDRGLTVSIKVIKNKEIGD